jgi:hypothetical protein
MGARNQFLHGMPVQPTMLRYRQSKGYAQLANIAPVLFNAALIASLNALRIPGKPMGIKKPTAKNIATYFRTHEGIDRVQRGLMAAGAPNLERV